MIMSNNGQVRQIEIRIHNGTKQPILGQDITGLRVRLLTTDPTTLIESVSWLGDAAFTFGANETIPPRGSKLSDPIPWPADQDPSSKLLLAQIIGAGHLPNIFDLPNPGDYATLLRWTGLLAWKQPSPMPVTLSLSDDATHTFTFSIGKLGTGIRRSTLRLDLNRVPAGVAVSLELAKTVIDGLFANNPSPGMTRIGSRLLELDPDQVPGRVIDLTGLSLSKRRHVVDLKQTYTQPAIDLFSSIEVSQYLEGHWVGLIRHQVKATIEPY